MMRVAMTKMGGRAKIPTLHKECVSLMRVGAAAIHPFLRLIVLWRSMTKLPICLAVLLGVAVPIAHAASFDCTKAQRPLEKLICGNPKLNAADERLGQTYRSGLQRLPAAGVGPLRADQVQWLAWMQEICHAPEPGATSSTPAAQTTDCMLKLYDQRARQLRGIATERDGVHLLLRTQYLAQPEEPVSVGTLPYPGFGTLQVSWPLALDDSPDWAAWNRATEAAAFAMANDDAPVKGAVAKAPQWTAALAEGADTEISVHMLRMEHGQVTSAVAMNTMGHGAAHPGEAAATMTWLLQARRALRADDVFQAGEAWKKAVTQACWTAIQSGEQRTYLYPQVKGPEDLQDVVSDVGNWTLEHDGLHISYPEYSLSPRMAMLPDTVISWTALQPVLAAGFTAP